MKDYGGLISRFVRHELDDGVRHILSGAFAERAYSKRVLLREFEFNCFDVTLDFENDTVVVQDIVCAGGDVSVSVSVEDFLVICDLSISF